MLSTHEKQQSGVLIVDDHPIVRLGLATLLSQFEHKFVIHETDNAEQAIQICIDHSPEVALIDLSIAGQLNLELIKRIHGLRPQTAILVVSMHDERIYAERVLRAGARGYVMKDHASKSIVHAVRAVREGKIWLSDDMRSAVLEKFADRSQKGNMNRIESLSDRELEVFRMIGQGNKKSEIAESLGISLSTVETYRSSIKRKLGIGSGWALYREAFTHLKE